MTSRKFLNLLLAEGVLITILGVLMLLLPRITSLATAIVIAIVTMVYGIFKFINSIITRKELKHAWLQAILGILLFVIGLYLFFYPILNLVVLTTMLAVYFLLESINTTSFAFQTRGILKHWWVNLFASALQFLLAVLILAGLPKIALWIIGIVLGVNLLFAGMSMIMVYLSTKFERDYI